MDPKEIARQKILHQQRRLVTSDKNSSTKRKRRHSESKAPRSGFRAQTASSSNILRRDSYPPVTAVKSQSTVSVSVKVEAHSVSECENTLVDQRSEMKVTVEKIAAKVKASRGKTTQFVNAATLPPPRQFERKRRRSSGGGRNDNDLGYKPRSNHRHPWQQERQDRFFAFEHGIPFESDDD